jgi:hypothetical protein
MKNSSEVTTNQPLENKSEPNGVNLEVEKTSQSDNLVKKFPKRSMKKSLGMLLSVLLIVFGGIGSGYLLSGAARGSSVESDTPLVSSEAIDSKTEAGVEDESAFPDEADGILVSGGIDGEGTHHLDRGLGESKYVYLTSTVIDLESFVGQNVQVWGQTVTARKAGWLMDVGKIKVVN